MPFYHWKQRTLEPNLFYVTANHLKPLKKNHWIDKWPKFPKWISLCFPWKYHSYVNYMKPILVKTDRTLLFAKMIMDANLTILSGSVRFDSIANNSFYNTVGRIQPLTAKLIILVFLWPSVSVTIYIYSPHFYMFISTHYFCIYCKLF